MDGVGLTVMHLIGRHQTDAGMVMLLIVPIEEAAAERFGILDAAEALWELRLVFHGFEVAFRERIVVGSVRPAVGFGDAEISEEERRGLGSHRSAAIGMQGQLAGRGGMLRGGVIEQRREQGGAFAVGDAPADDSAAEDVDDDVEIEVRPFRRPHQFCYVPGPYLVGRLRQQLRLFVNRMAQLIAALADFLVCDQDAVHGADRAVVDALVEQAGIDLSGRLVGEARCAQKTEHGLAFHGGKCPPRAWSGARRHPWTVQIGAPAVNAGARHVHSRAGAGG